MRYQVPQFVDVEDKIIGPFTLKQFLMYVAAAMALVPVYLFSDLPLFITIALPVFGVAAAFAHVRIAHKSLSQTIFNAVNFVGSGQLFIWRRGKGKLIGIHDSAWQETLSAEEGRNENSSLTNVARNLETGGNVVTTEEVEDVLDATT